VGQHALSVKELQLGAITDGTANAAYCVCFSATEGSMERLCLVLEMIEVGTRGQGP
jgi:hypothetical protein